MSALKLTSDNVFIKRLKENIMDLGFLEDMQNQLDLIRPVCEAVSSFYISFGARVNISKDCKAEDSYTEKIKNCAAALGFDNNIASQKRRIRANTELSNALFCLFPDELDALNAFADRYTPLLDASILDLRAEIDFYISVHNLAQKAKNNNISVCFPKISKLKLLRAKNAYDITLLLNAKDIVPNDIDFSEAENAYFLTGANGGGKTTYLRAVATNLLFALAGCPVFCDSAEFFPFKSVYTHFPADERPSSGRFFEEKQRVDEISSSLTAESFVFLNETFSGTDFQKGSEMTLETANIIKQSGAFLLYVTHFHDVLGKGIPIAAYRNCFR